MTVRSAKRAMQLRARFLDPLVFLTCVMVTSTWEDSNLLCKTTKL